MKISNEMTNDQFMTEVGQRIRHVRIQARIKQSELAARCGISRSALVKLEQGDGGVRLLTLVVVLRTLDLLGGIDVALPPVELSPNEMVEIEHHRKPLPQRVRSSGKSRGCKVWGDGTVIVR